MSNNKYLDLLDELIGKSTEIATAVSTDPGKVKSALEKLKGIATDLNLDQAQIQSLVNSDVTKFSTLIGTGGILAAKAQEVGALNVLNALAKSVSLGEADAVTGIAPFTGLRFLLAKDNPVLKNVLGSSYSTYAALLPAAPAPAPVVPRTPGAPPPPAGPTNSTAAGNALGQFANYVASGAGHVMEEGVTFDGMMKLGGVGLLLVGAKKLLTGSLWDKTVGFTVCMAIATFFMSGGLSQAAEGVKKGFQEGREESARNAHHAPGQLLPPQVQVNRNGGYSNNTRRTAPSSPD